MKKILAVILAVVMLLTTGTTIALATDDPTLKVGTAADAIPGEEISIDISFENNPGVMAVILGLSYDKDVLTYLGFSNGAFDGWDVTATGAVWVGGSDDNTDGTILTLKFKVNDDAVLGNTVVTVTFAEGDIANYNEEIIMPDVVAGGVKVVVGPHDCVWDAGVVTTDPGCETTGVKTYTCSVCGDTKTEDIAATGHDYDGGVVTTEPDCETNGVKTFTCANCGDTYTEEVAATGHDYSSVVTAPTCTEKGYTTHTCACGDSYVDSYVDEAGHSFGAWTETKAPTCTEKGAERRECANCDHYETRETAEKGHDYSSVVTAPTCTEKGYTTHTCACGDSYVDSYVDATDHAWDDGVVTKEATEETEGEMLFTCETCGETKTQIIPTKDHEHVYDAVVTAPTCTEKGYTTHTCRCGDSYDDTYVKALGHTGGTATCKDLAVCTRCGESYGKLDKYNHAGETEVRNAKEPTCTDRGYTGDTYCGCGVKLESGERISATGHSYGEWTETTAPTCTEKGTERRDCANCDSYETRKVAATGHNYNAVVTAPTCTEKGYTTYTCVCGKSYVDNYVKATGHNYGEWTETAAPTCTEKGTERRDCANCDSYETRETAAKGHNYNAVVTEPTCTEKGYTTYTCVCGDSYVDYVDAKGHTWDDGVVTKEATEDTEGEKLFTCEVCGDTKTQIIPAKDHEHSYSAAVTAPTCTEKGYTTHTCRCGDSYVDTYVKELGHDYAGEVTTEPGCATKGEKTYTCGNCGDRKTEEIDATGHDYVGEVTTEPGCATKGEKTYTCDNCGDTYKEEVAEAGHKWDKGTVTVEPTDTTKGEKTFACENCDETKTETIPVLSSGPNTGDNARVLVLTITVLVAAIAVVVLQKKVRKIKI